MIQSMKSRGLWVFHQAEAKNKTWRWPIRQIIRGALIWD
jgi:hypothetical protein